MLRPLPPFRANPSRRPLAPKRQAAKTESEISVKAPRRSVKIARLQPAPALKVLRDEAQA